MPALHQSDVLSTPPPRANMEEEASKEDAAEADSPGWPERLQNDTSATDEENAAEADSPGWPEGLQDDTSATALVFVLVFISTAL